MNKLKGLKEDLNKAIRQLAEAQAEGIETRSFEEEVEKIRDEIVAFEDEIRANTITITDEVNNKGVEKMENNKEFRQALKSGENLAEMEVRSHHIMGTVSGGSDFSAQRKETLQQNILRKMGEDARLVGFIPFKEQNGKVRIPISSNKGKVAKVSEGERFAEKNYQLSYKTADTVKYSQISTLTNELLEDSDLAIQQFVVEETARDYARTLEEDFLKGNIPGKVEGVAVCPQAKQVVLAGDEITVTDLKKAYFSLPVDVRNAQDLLFITDTAGILELDCLTDANGRALLQPYADPQMSGKYFDKLYNAKVVEVEATALPVGTVGVFLSPSLAVHAGLARTMNINVDHSKRSEYDETVVLSSMRCGFIVKDADAIAILKTA
jgi:HK97 family phage major capsid protein